ncbi:DegT/DnrJ/EryC1/StrS family aminotransferase [Sanguibacter sp. HDW7]|uniref:DegT/DnrJ/EryC1/StrS family aminotransferase n=1 Tax=Sanguibacter sp. HDW7 TaxID=2714931 RepID=UPI00140C7718|nr:DegT/DnrJ/EryC1/StrS family aminotransferase [Sanguibacter sp. HDW7]QIK83637.1 DegT/DnrJ/EryC1/StrS aminotransferase family protein [Sanguibacter sp. HDW7]
MTQHDTTTVTQELARRTGTEPGDWFLVHKARYGMEVVLRALAEHRGAGDVVTQILTCATAVDPILVAGHAAVHADVDPGSLAIDPARLDVGERTRAVVLQHTFGIVDDAAARGLRAAADGIGALLLEDSAHCVGRMARDAAGRPYADVSIHSFGVEKMLSTRFGGAIWVAPDLVDGALGDLLRARLGALPVVGRRLDLLARAYRTQIRVLNRLPQRVARTLRGGLVRAGLLDPAIAPVEMRGGLPYSPSAPSAWMTAQVAAALPGLAADEERRAACVTAYVEALAGIVEIPSAILDGVRAGEPSPLVRLPLLARDEAAAERLLAELGSARVHAGRWYRPALFPGVEDPATYGYTPGDPTLTTSEDAISRLVNLPTNVTVERAREIAAVVRDVVSG